MLFLDLIYVTVPIRFLCKQVIESSGSGREWRNVEMTMYFNSGRLSRATGVEEERRLSHSSALLF